MARILPAYLTALVLLVAADSLWLGFVARDFYAAQLGDMLRPSPDFGAAVLFYLLYAAGLTHFAVLPGRRRGWRHALGNGAFLGLVAYATYDLSNLATLVDWPVAMSVVDVAWGTVLSAGVATLACAILARFGRA